MKILLIHNKYILRGGEDSVFDDELALLRDNGNEVITYTRNNKETESYNFFQKLFFPINMIFSCKTYREVSKLLKEEKPDIVHIHNFFPLISPSVFFACKKHNVPVVMTLHNFRLVGGNALLMRDGKINEESLQRRNPFLEVKYRTYKNSFIHTFLLSLMLFIHKNTFKKLVTRYIALTEFTKNKYVEGGLPKNKIEVKPNFIQKETKPSFSKNDYAIFVGRLSEEKGIKTLAKAWKNVPFTLKVFGNGPLKELLIKNKNVDYQGHKPIEEVIKAVSKARFLIISSEWYECFPKTILEAFSVGTPVLASKVGNMEFIIEQNKTGRFFKMGDSNDLAKQAKYLFDHKNECEAMGKNAFKEYKSKYTAKINYEQLMNIYEGAINDVEIFCRRE